MAEGPGGGWFPEPSRPGGRVLQGNLDVPNHFLEFFCGLAVRKSSFSASDATWTQFRWVRDNTGVLHPGTHIDPLWSVLAGGSEACVQARMLFLQNFLTMPARVGWNLQGLANSPARRLTLMRFMLPV